MKKKSNITNEKMSSQQYRDYILKQNRKLSAEVVEGNELPAVKKRNVPHETLLVIGCVQWFHHVFSGKYIIKMDNEGKRHWISGMQKKKEGLTPGASDLFIAEPIERVATIHDYGPAVYTNIIEHRAIKYNSVRYAGAWLEAKFGKNTLSDKQTKFQKDMHDRGYYIGAFWTFDEFVDHCNIYFGTNHKLNTWKK